MKKFNDSKIYLIIISVSITVAVILGGVSLYSKISVEPKVKALLATDSTIKEGYLLLREPQIFGGYSYWDSDGMGVKNSIRYFDGKLFRGENIVPEEKIYLELILKRRESGSSLGLKSALFMLLVSLTGCAAYIIERKKA